MTQDTALDILKTGANVFLTGEPGAGKTHTLNRYIEYLKDHKIPVAVTASTGIAATHVGGMTIHAWSGIGIKDELTPYDLDQITTRERVVKRITKAKVLVIDEISMLDAHTLSMVEQVVRTVKGLPLPFGGMQVVLVGDFFQLPPIGRRGEVVQFAFESPAWHGLDLLTCYLSEQHRQDDGSLLSLLSNIRAHEIDESCYELLQSCSETNFKEGIEPTKLYTHNADVDRMNGERLKALPGTSRKFEMVSRGQKQLVDGLKRSCLSPEVLELKEGAMVMCTKNNFEVGYVNGTLGQVVDFDSDNGRPIIETLDGRTLTISPNIWTVEDGGKVLAEVTQIPLRLAWAITVHKSQGMSLDAAEIDLNNAFEYGQGYVALSRVRTLEGLLLRGANQRALEVHPKILMRDASFKEHSENGEEAFLQMEEEELHEMHKKFITANGGTLKADDSWKEEEVTAKKSTYEVTYEMLKDGKTVSEIAEVRNLKEGTVIEHVEKLLHDKLIKRSELTHLEPKDEKERTMHDELLLVFKDVGTEKLKPAYEATGGRYSYDQIKFVRIFALQD